MDELDQRIGALEFCQNCTHWRWHFLDRDVYGSRGLMASYQYRSHAGKVAEFSVEMPSGCIEELSIELRRRPDLWHSMHPTRLEKLVAEIVRANFDYVEVTHVGGPRDGGVDVLWVQSQRRRWLIQVKRRIHQEPAEAVSTIRNLLGTMVLKRSTFGAVVSTADHFSFDAHRAVKDAAAIGMTIELVSRPLLESLLGPLLPKQPWAHLLEREYRDFLPYFATDEAPSKIGNRQLPLFR